MIILSMHVGIKYLALCQCIDMKYIIFRMLHYMTEICIHLETNVLNLMLLLNF